MIPSGTRASYLAIASASLFYASTAHAQEPPRGAPAAPPAVEGAPARMEPVAPVVQQPAPPMLPMTPPMVRRVDASEPRKITGMVLTAIGIFHGFAGTVTLTTFATMDDGFGVLLGLIIGGPMIGDGLILSSIGIPLWVSGARTVEKIDGAAGEPVVPAWVPSVDLGAGSGTAIWHF